MAQTTAGSSGSAPAESASPTNADLPAGTDPKTRAPRREAKEDKQEQKGKQLLEALCPAPLANDPTIVRVTATAAQSGDSYEPAAGAASNEAGPNPSGPQAQVPAPQDVAPNPLPAASDRLAFAGRLVQATPEIKAVGGSTAHSAAAPPDGPAPDFPVAAAPDPAAADKPDDAEDATRAVHGRANAASLQIDRASAQAQDGGTAADQTALNPPVQTPPHGGRSEHAKGHLPEPVGTSAPPAVLEPNSPAVRGPARQIALEISRGDARVDVRLSERGGEVLVSVRTPDARLAGDLRGDLPSLAAKLEQTGLHATSWHSDSGFGRQPERHFDSQSQESGGGGGQRQHERRDGRQQEDGDFAPRSKTQNRKDFAWFMTSLG